MNQVKFDPLMEFTDDTPEVFLPEVVINCAGPRIRSERLQCRIEFDEDGMKTWQWILLQPRFSELPVAMCISNDGPNLVLTERLFNGAPGVARLGSLAGKTRISREQDFHR